MKPRIALLCALLSAALFAAPKPEWKIRPWEIMQGLKPRGVQLWRLDQDGLDGWKVSGCGATKVEATDLTKLWGEKVARVDFDKEGPVLTVTPPKPLPIPEDADGLEIWLYGPVNRGQGSKPQFSILVADAANKQRRLYSTGAGSRWAKNRWWGTTAAAFPKDLQRPLKFISFSMHKPRIAGPDFFCFDQINAFRFGKFAIPDTSKMNLGFPTTPDTILPSSAAIGSRNERRRDGKSWLFTYTGKDAKIAYRYTPKDGTLGDFTASFNGGKPFQPAKLGGPRAKVGNVVFAPGDPAIKATLLSTGFTTNHLVFNWRWSKDGKHLDFSYTISCKGKSIVVVADSRQLDITAFDTGAVAGVRKPQLFALTYLHNRWNYPRFLATPDFLASAFCDWYTSNASSCVEGSSVHGLQGATVLGPDTARLMGGTAYIPKTDGKLNPLHERYVFTVSRDLADILPNIPNPRAKFYDEMSRLVCFSRAYSLQGQPAHADQELAFWTKMKQYGMTDLFLRYHSGLFRTPLENNRTTFEMAASRSNGDDAVVVKLVDGLRALFPRVGVYQDNRIIAPNDPLFDYGLVSRSASGQFVEGWDGCFRPKPAMMLPLSKAFFPKFLNKYHFNAEYLDELTNAPPWADVDFDASVPGAGTFSRVIRDFGAVALLHRELFNGPIWSEGCAAFFWAGLLDTDYAVSNDTKAGLPLIVDFKLRKILPLETYNGADWPVDAGWDADRLVATEIAEGNIGILIFGNYQQGLAVRTDKTKLDLFLKSYFMIRQVQEHFCASPVAEIKYFVDGKLMTASEMLMAGKTSQNRIYARYENGLETWVNRAPEGDWTIQVDGKTYVLPPSGHFARRPGYLLQYSALVDGRRVDYSKGHLYTYLNGGGKPFAFPEATVAGPYLLRRRGDATLLTPVPFQKPERIARLDARTATPCAPDEKSLAAPAPITALSIDGKAFHYLLK